MISNILKFILGILLAFTILIGSGLAAALYFVNRTATPPGKPLFSNENSIHKSPPKKVIPAKAKTRSDSQPSPSPAATPTPTPSPTPEGTPQPLPPGAYRGIVTWPQGLSLRATPEQNSQRVGGIGFQQKVIILEESPDQVWQKIRLEDGTMEGWVKSRNTKRIEEQEETPTPEATPQ